MVDGGGIRGGLPSRWDLERAARPKFAGASWRPTPPAKVARPAEAAEAYTKGRQSEARGRKTAVKAKAPA